jgi:transposase-like protein
MTPLNESVLKTDQIGRLRYTPEQKKTMVDAYRTSGLSAPRFAAHHGVNYQTLVSRIKKDKQSSTPTTPNSSPSNILSKLAEGCLLREELYSSIISPLAAA